MCSFATLRLEEVDVNGPVTPCALLSHPGGDPMSHEPETDLFEETVRQYKQLALGKDRFDNPMISSFRNNHIMPCQQSMLN